MTLGTNASLEELIKYSPQEIDFDFLLAELKELEEWRELLDKFEYRAADVKERITDLEIQCIEKAEQITALEDDLDESINEIERLKETIENLTPSD